MTWSLKPIALLADDLYCKNWKISSNLAFILNFWSVFSVIPNTLKRFGLLPTFLENCWTDWAEIYTQCPSRHVIYYFFITFFSVCLSVCLLFVREGTAKKKKKPLQLAPKGLKWSGWISIPLNKITRRCLSVCLVCVCVCVCLCVIVYMCVLTPSLRQTDEGLFPLGVEMFTLHQ